MAVSDVYLEPDVEAFFIHGERTFEMHCVVLCSISGKVIRVLSLRSALMRLVL